MVVAPLGLGHQLIAREPKCPFLLRRAPSSTPSAQERIEQQVTSDLQGTRDRFDEPAHVSPMIVDRERW
jgi:hypothetical protein